MNGELGEEHCSFYACLPVSSVQCNKALYKNITLFPGAGDDTRAWGPPFVGTESVYYLSVNRNKKVSESLPVVCLIFFCDE